MHRVRHFLVLALVLAAVATACGGDGEGGGGGRNAAGTSTTVEGDGGRGGANDHDGSDNGNQGADGNGGGDDLLDAADGDAQPPAFDPSKPVPADDVPEDGRYKYDYTELGGEPEERRLDVLEVASGAGWRRQRHSFYGHTDATKSLVVWLADHSYQEVEQRARADQIAAACVWDPGYVLLRLPLATGASWQSDSRCSTDAADRHRTQDATVTGPRTVQIGGEAVEGFVIKRTVTTTTEVHAATPVVTTEIEVVEDVVEPERRLLLESSGTRSASIQGAPSGVPEQFILRLRSLTPGSFDD